MGSAHLAPAAHRNRRFCASRRLDRPRRRAAGTLAFDLWVTPPAAHFLEKVSDLAASDRPFQCAHSPTERASPIRVARLGLIFILKASTHKHTNSHTHDDVGMK